MFHVGLDIHSTRIAICVLNETGQVVHRSQVRGHRGDAAHPQGPARPLRGLLRGQLRLRPLPRPAPPAGRAGPGGPPGATAADLPVEEQERPQRRRAAGEAAVPRRDADGARALARGPDLAGADQLPQPGDRQADAGQERAPRAAAQRRRRAPEAARPVDEEGAGVAPPTGPADGLAAAAAGPAARGDRDAHPPGAADRAGVEPPGPADAGRRADCGPSPASAPARPRRWPRSSTTRTASATPRRSAGTSGWSRARTSRATGTGSGTSPARAPPVVRQLVAEAAWQAIRRSPTVRAFFERAQRDDPQRKKIALVATAHYLVRVMWAMLRHGTVWQESVAQAA